MPKDKYLVGSVGTRTVLDALLSLYWLILFSNNSLGRGTLMYGVLAVRNEGWKERTMVGRSLEGRRDGGG
jgi:hypothetical protein